MALQYVIQMYIPGSCSVLSVVLQHRQPRLALGIFTEANPSIALWLPTWEIVDASVPFLSMHSHRLPFKVLRQESSNLL
jgi:hypothetical protein